MKRAAVLACLALSLASCGNERIYADGCGALPDGWIAPRHGRGELSVLNVIDVPQADRIEWNGKPISQSTLNDVLKQARSLNPLPVTHIRFGSKVDCATVKRLRTMVSNNLDCTHGSCAEGAGRWLMHGDVLFDGKPSEPYDRDQTIVDPKQ